MSHAFSHPVYTTPQFPLVLFDIICSSGCKPFCKSVNLTFSLYFFICPLGWSTLAPEKVLPSWTLSCHLACVQVPSKAWRLMCSGWILPRTCPPGLICWWRVATVLPSSSRRSPRVRRYRDALAVIPLFLHSPSTSEVCLLNLLPIGPLLGRDPVVEKHWCRLIILPLYNKFPKDVHAKTQFYIRKCWRKSEGTIMIQVYNWCESQHI